MASVVLERARQGDVPQARYVPPGFAAPAPARAKLRVVLLADWRAQPRWIAESFAQIAGSTFAEVVLIAELGAPTPSSPWLWRAYRRLDDRAFGRRRDASDPLDLTRCLPACPFVSVDGDRAQREALLEELNSLRIDVVFTLGVEVPGGERLARYGAWRYTFGSDGRDAEPFAGLRDVAAGDALTASGLRARLPGGEERVLHESWSRTFLVSPARTRDNLLPKTAQFAARALKALQGAGDAWLASHAQAAVDASPVALRAGPGPLEALGHVARQAVRVSLRALQKLLYVDQWFLGYTLGAAQDWTGDLRGFVRLLPPRDRFWADPFALQRDGRHYIFFEELVFRRGKAHISVVEVGPTGAIGEPRIVLQRDYHLSYPFLIEDGGELFMVPETGKNRTVEIYRCLSFPDQWKREKVLLSGQFYTDATFHRADDGTWWMFVNIGFEGTEGADELHLYYADTLLGEWTPHAQNPVKSDVRGTRPAGRLYREGGALYRPAQIGAPIYGAGIAVNEVLELTPERYAEQEVRRLLPTRPRSVLGLHTLNRAGQLCVIDAFSRRLRV